MEEAYKHEKEIKEVIEQFIQSHSFHGLQDNLDAAKDETGENRLLPAMNKIWPFFVSCFQNKNLLVSACTKNREFYLIIISFYLLHDDLFKKFMKLWHDSTVLSQGLIH